MSIERNRASNAPVSDATLAARSQAGDHAAFGELVRRHMRRAFAIAYRIVQDREDAEDVTQEAFLAAFRAVASFDTTRPFAPWIGRIVARKGLNALARRRLRRTEPVSETIADRAPTPFQKAAQSQLAAHVRAAMSRLPPRQRSVVELIELEEYNATEAAGLLGISPGTARWHLHQARAALRAGLQIG